MSWDQHLARVLSKAAFPVACLSPSSSLVSGALTSLASVQSVSRLALERDSEGTFPHAVCVCVCGHPYYLL